MALGVSTTQFYRGNQILRGFDAEVQNLVSNEMQNKGINLNLKHDVRIIVLLFLNVLGNYNV